MSRHSAARIPWSALAASIALSALSIAGIATDTLAGGAGTTTIGRVPAAPSGAA